MQLVSNACVCEFLAVAVFGLALPQSLAIWGGSVPKHSVANCE